MALTKALFILVLLVLGVMVSPVCAVNYDSGQKLYKGYIQTFDLNETTANQACQAAFGVNHNAGTHLSYLNGAYFFNTSSQYIYWPVTITDSTGYDFDRYLWTYCANNQFTTNGNYYYIFHYKASGSPITAPVANFTNIAYPKTCYSPGEYVDLDPDASTGSPTSWYWELYGGTNYTDIQTSTEHYPLFELPDVGLYSVELNATNSAGSGSHTHYDWLEVALGGNCTLLEQNVSVIPTMAPVPTGIENVIVRQQLRNLTQNSFVGNLSGGWFNASDYFVNGVNATFFDIVGIFTTPLDWLTLAVGTVFTDIADLTEPFADTSNFFLQMVSRSLAALPAVIVNLVTLGLLVDVVRLVLAGRGDAL